MIALRPPAAPPAPPDDRQRAGGAPSGSSDKAKLSPVENSDFAAFLRRVIRAHGRRVGEGDLDGLAELAALEREVAEALAAAVAALRAEPHAHSWSAVAEVLGVTKQAAMQRWPEAGGARRPGGQPARLR